MSVNDQPVPVTGRSFRTTVALQEGFNLIRITFTNEEKGFTRTVYRRVVRHSGPVGLTIETPLPGAYLNNPEIMVSGTVQGVGELQVTVNGIPAVVSGGFYQASIRLDEGENLLVVEAADARGETARRNLTSSWTPSRRRSGPCRRRARCRAEIEVTGRSSTAPSGYLSTAAGRGETGAFRGLQPCRRNGPDNDHAEDQAGNIAIPRHRFPSPSRSTRRAGRTTNRY